MTCMDKETKELLESSIGKVIEVDVPNDEVGWGQFLKVQIEINLQQPLALGRFINFNKRKMWIPICFKKLSRFCFKCRLIWHADQGYHFLASTLKGMRVTNFGLGYARANLIIEVLVAFVMLQ